MNNSEEIKKNVSQVIPEKKNEMATMNTANVENGKNDIVGLMNEFYALKQQVVRMQNENEKLKELVSMKFSAKENGFEETTDDENRIKNLIMERDRYKALAIERIKDNILREIKSEYPDIKVNSVDELPKGFHSLIRAKGEPALAYRVIMEREKAKNDKVPASMGSINAQSEKDKEFYSSAEVDKLTKKQLSDPKVMNTVMKSMLKW